MVAEPTLFCCKIEASLHLRTGVLNSHTHRHRMSQHYRKNSKSYEQADEYVNEQTMALDEQRQREEERQMRMEEQQYIFEERLRLIEEQRNVIAPMGFSDRVLEECRHEKQDTPSLFFNVISPQMLAAQAEHVMKAPDTCRCWHCMDAKPPTISATVKAAQESERKRIALCCGAAARMRQVCAN